MDDDHVRAQPSRAEEIDGILAEWTRRFVRDSPMAQAGDAGTYALQVAIPALAGMLKEGLV